MKAFLDKSSTGNPNALTNPGSKKKAWLAQDSQRRSSFGI